MKQKKAKKKKCFFLGFITVVLVMMAVCMTIKVIPIVTAGYKMYQEAISKESIEEAIAEIKEDDTYLTLDEIPESYKGGVVASEDKRFYKHSGMDLYATLRAVIVNLKAGSYKEGGSTITQQLAKNLYFSFEKKVERKVAELFVARDLEKMLTKDEILELYCNIAYFGEGCYGLEEAAEHYYGVDASQLSESQANALVFTIKSPNNYNPNVYEGAIA